VKLGNLNLPLRHQKSSITFIATREQHRSCRMSLRAQADRERTDVEIGAARGSI
jgi:hypothetical protein